MEPLRQAIRQSPHPWKQKMIDETYRPFSMAIAECVREIEAETGLVQEMVAEVRKQIEQGSGVNISDMIQKFAAEMQQRNEVAWQILRNPGSLRSFLDRCGR